MNVQYPGEGSHAGFWVIVGFMVAAAAALVGFFRWKRWL
jgi:Mg2+ and Co2+ transporter CorA